jgi:plasmid stabilization system protein ParE
MKIRYEFSETALEDLADIWSFFARVSGDESAQRRVDAIFARVDVMSIFPESGVLHRGKRKNVRRWLVGTYIIFYIFDGECIRVERVLNARRGDLETEI